MVDPKIVDRITKLIALSTSPYEQEARTAAHQACKLILSHGLVVHAKPAPAPPPKPAQAPPPTTAPRPINSRFASYCANCGGDIMEGERILWKRGIGSTHLVCREWWAGK